MDYVEEIKENIIDNGFVDNDDAVYLILEIERLRELVKDAYEEGYGLIDSVWSKKHWEKSVSFKALKLLND